GMLGKQIKHSGDRFEDWEAYEQRSDHRPAKPHKEPSREGAEEAEIVQEEMLQRMTADWLDQPSLDGKLTPRQAAQTPEGRKKVIEVLKQIEYHNDQRARNGERPIMNADYIRRELGI
ncbi:MAG: hypothetical protein KJ727_13585, partial [Acidobacteria bacterium]|nr:hypothetical protein [Acidobacteriota bacterium]